MENGVEKNISKESVSKVVTLSREISRIKVLDDNSPEANERARNFLKGNFGSSQYESVEQMINLSQDPGHKGDGTQKNAKDSLDLLGSAILLAGQDKVEKWTTSAEVLAHLPSNFAGVETVLANNLLVNGEDDQIGKEIVAQLGVLEKASRRAAMAPNSYEETRERETKKTIDVLLDKYDNVDPDSEDAEKIGAVVGSLDGGLKKAESIIISRQKGEDGKDNDRAAQEKLDRELKESAIRESRGSQEPPEGEDDGNGKERGSFYFMTQSDLIDLDMTQRNKDQFHFSPPYPQWFKELKSFDEQKIWLLRCKLINGVAYKQALRNIDADKLFGNRALDITNEETRLLCNLEGFQKSLKMMFDDLFVWENEASGERFLNLKQRELTKEEKDKGYVGKPLDREVEKILTDNSFEFYKEKLALRLQYPDKNKKEIDELFNKLYSEKKRANNKYRGVVALAWDLAYIGNMIESADSDRQLKPTEVVSDKLRTMLHPMQKAMGKWGVFKQGKESIDGISGEEEPMGGDIASWIRYHLELGEIRGKNNFRQQLINGEIQPLPRRAACSLLEMYMVNVKGQEGKITMAEAIMGGKEIVFVNSKDDLNSRGGDLDIFTEFRDTMDGCKTAYNYLTGNAKLEVGKSEYEWARKFNADIALIRQMNAVKKKDGRVNTLSFVSDPEFIAWVIASSAGFDIKGNGIVLNFKSIGATDESYDIAVKKVIDLPDLVKLGSRDGKIEQILNADRGWLSTKRMLRKHYDDVLVNEIAVRKHGKKIKRESGSFGRNYRGYGDR